jgi:hypothetical protein
MSDQEFVSDWQGKLDQTPRYLTSTRDVQLVPGAGGYEQEAAKPYVDDIMNQNKDAWIKQASGAGWNIGDITANWQSATNMGYIPTLGADGAISLSRNAYGANPQSVARSTADQTGFAGGQTVTETIQTENPLWQAAANTFLQAQKERGENQIRQQLAYDTFLAGDGNIGGVIRPSYADPNAGMITGQAPGASTSGLPGFGGITDGLTGVDDTSQSGAYSGGSGRYNPSPFAPDAFTNRNPWAYR